MEKRSTALWRNAVPLNLAWLEFAAPDQRRAHEGLPTLKDLAEQQPNFPEDAGFFQRAISIFSDASKVHLARKASESNLKAALLLRISRGEFELLGYRVAPTKSRGPVVIPDPNFRRNAPDWDEESLEIRDEIYQDLRVSPVERRPTGAKRGRPGSTEIILAAIDELCAAPNSDFCKISRKDALKRVRDLLQAKGIDVNESGKGLSQQNVSKLILTRCPPRRIK